MDRNNDNFDSPLYGQGGTSGGSTGGSLGGTGGVGGGTGGLGSTGGAGSTDFGGSSGAGMGGTSGGVGGGYGGSTESGALGSGTEGQSFGGSGAGTTGGDQANRMQNAKDTAREKLGQVKERATQLQATLADRLEQGADRLRQRSMANQLAGTGAAGGTAGVGSNDQMAQVTNQLASGMAGTADWLRNGDLQADVERQVKEHPGRTLLIAVGLGYLLGKALRR